VAMMFQRTRRAREKFPRLEVSRLRGGLWQIVDRIPLSPPGAIPARVLARLQKIPWRMGGKKP